MSGACSGVTLAYSLAGSFHGDQRPCAAQPHASHAFNQHLMIHACLGDFLFKRLANLIGARREAPGGDTDAHVMRELLLRLTLGLRDLAQFVDGHGRIPFWMRASIPVGATLPSTALSTTAAGASPQEPRQRAVSRESSPSGVVSPGLMP